VAEPRVAVARARSADSAIRTCHRLEQAETRSAVDEQCHYTAWIKREPDARVALSTCSGVVSKLYSANAAAAGWVHCSHSVKANIRNFHFRNLLTHKYEPHRHNYYLTQPIIYSFISFVVYLFILFAVYLRMLSVLHMMWRKIMGYLMNNEFKRILKEAAFA
jgi:hypothetical protein